MRISDWSSDVCSSDLDNAGNSELKPGDYKYLDWNEDGVIDDKDVHPIMGGNYGQQSTPKLSYGMSLFAEYQGFDLSVVFQGGAMGTIMYRSEEHTYELQSLMRISYAVFCLKKKIQQDNTTISDS